MSSKLENVETDLMKVTKEGIIMVNSTKMLLKKIPLYVFLYLQH
jgi:hypothetical protein